MKKLLATSAIALVALSGAASAQSVLERVLGQIDNATNLASVNGTFANIAENIGGGTTTAYMDANGDIFSQTQYDAALNSALDSISASTTVTGTGTGAVTSIVYSYGGSSYTTMAAAVTAAEADIEDNYTAFQTQGGGVDGSITNIVDGIDQATQTAIASASVSAIEWNMPTLNFGDMATTALGAVNTGDITLGVNSSVDDAQTSTTQAVSSVMDQIGGSADTGAIVLNVASNMTGVNGSITNTMAEVNGNIGNLATTALGAVNTGTIVSGVNAAVQGITGTSGQDGVAVQ